MDDDSLMDDLINEYTTESDVLAAMEEKAAGEFVEEEDLGEVTKDYPKSQRKIDLHGMTGGEAVREIEYFVVSAQKQRLKTVTLITGKGLHSAQGKSVLPQLAEQKLAEFKRQGIVFSWKKERDGGSFVVYLV